MADFKHISIDGTKMQANASKHKAMSYERMNAEYCEQQGIDADISTARQRHGQAPGDTPPLSEKPAWMRMNQKL